MKDIGEDRKCQKCVNCTFDYCLANHCEDYSKYEKTDNKIFAEFLKSGYATMNDDDLINNYKIFSRDLTSIDNLFHICCAAYECQKRGIILDNKMKYKTRLFQRLLGEKI